MEVNGFVDCRASMTSPIVSYTLSVRLSVTLVGFYIVNLITGINYESSFEAEILHNTNHCQIWGYDFSVKSFGPEITSDISHRTHFKAYRLDGEDKFGPEDDPPQYTLETLLEKNGNVLSPKA